MEYQGKLYGKLAGGYIELNESSDDVQVMKDKLERAEAVIEDLINCDPNTKLATDEQLSAGLSHHDPRVALGCKVVLQGRLFLS